MQEGLIRTEERKTINPFEEKRLNYPTSLKKLSMELFTNTSYGIADSARIISGLNIMNSTGADKISINLTDGKIHLTNISDESISFRYVRRSTIISDVVDKYQLLLIMKVTRKKIDKAAHDILLTLEV